MVPIASYSARVLRFMLYQYRNSDNLRGIVAASCGQADDLETALFELRDNFFLGTAAGAQLDILGEIFGVPRNGQDDAAYRTAIRLRAASQFSATPEDVIQSMFAFFGATYARYSDRTWPAAFTLETDAAITQAELEAISPAGVACYLISPSSCTIDYISGDPIPFIGGGYLTFIGAC